MADFPVEGHNYPLCELWRSRKMQAGVLRDIYDAQVWKDFHNYNNATYGCTKCTKKFPGGVGNKDYSGFDRENWVSRTVTEHKNVIN